MSLQSIIQEMSLLPIRTKEGFININLYSRQVSDFCMDPTHHNLSGHLPSIFAVFQEYHQSVRQLRSKFYFKYKKFIT